MHGTSQATLNNLVTGIAAVAAPPPQLRVSEWADEYRMLSPESSAEPGRWRTSRTPYLQEILDSLNNPSIEEVILCSSAQIGKTEAQLCILGYYIHQDPAPVLFVMPTLELAEAISKDRIAPMVRDCPALAARIGDPRSRDSGNTLLHKEFPAGRLTLCGSNSPASLSSRPCRIILCDEVDRFTAAGTEGDVVNLAKKRTSTFFNRKLVLTSTPTIKGASRIWSAFESSDQRRFFIPCPECGHEQYLKWPQVKWDWDKDPSAAWYECEGCGHKMSDAQKKQMVRLGRWQPTATPKQGTAKSISYHLWAAYSPWMSLGDCAQEFLAAKDDPQTLKVWVNTCLGEPFDEEGGEGLEWQRLMARAEPYAPWTVPEGALVLTAGVDVQKDRLACSIWGWGAQEESWLIGNTELWGDPLLDAVWGQLTELLSATYRHESGADLSISATAIDTGYQPQAIYRYCRAQGQQCYALKGVSTPGRPIIGRPSYQEVTYRGKVYKRGVKLWPVGVDVCKGVLYGRLRLQGPGSGFVHFPIGLDEEYYQQICAEKVTTRFHKGFPRREWVKTRPRNEALDCAVYAYAVAIAIGLPRLDAEKLRKKLFPEAIEAAQDEPVLSDTTASKEPWIERNKSWMSRY
ncbi:MAG: phage terminase large subunit family protein [Acaryochloridaceae cyanobacterium SU_2_1]|nr:phage terminase large subunit family protein [Acaryochloridaceae cyanobacterium SU_2_1]